MSTLSNPLSIVLIDADANEFTIDIGNGQGTLGVLGGPLILETTAELKIKCGDARIAGGFGIEILEEVYST